jgi:four helix bundle protein
LALSVYRISNGFPTDERYGLTSQLRRTCVSIPANIAEGCGRRGAREMSRFLQIAMGSASELEYHLLLAHDLGLLDNQLHRELDRHSGQTRAPEESGVNEKRRLRSCVSTSADGQLLKETV